MPQVPVYGDRQVRTDALRPVMQQAPDVSSGARALAQGLGAVADAADRIDLRDAETKANEIDTQLTRDWIKWEDENRGKFTNQSADGYTKAVDAWWKEAAKTYGSGLDGRSQAMVGRTLSRRQTIALDQAGKYEFAEKEKYADSTTASAINTATVNALKTGDYDGEAQRIRGLVEAQGVRKNWSKEQRDAERNARMGAFNTAVIAQLAEKDASAAQVYLTGAIKRGEIRPDQQPRLEAIVKGEADNQFAKVEAVRIRALPPDQQKTELAKITDPKRLEKTQTELNNLSAIDRRLREETQDAARDQVYQRFEQGKPIPEALLSAMGGPERSQFENLRLARATREAKGEKVKTNWDLYAELRQRINDGEKLTLAPYSEQIADAQLKDLAEHQTQVVKDPEARTSEAQLRAATAELKLKGEKLGKFQAAYGEEVNAFMKENGGKKPNYDQRVDIIYRLTQEVVTHDGLIWDSTQRGYLLPRDQRGGSSASARPAAAGPAAAPRTVGTIYNISGPDRAAITNKLRERGVAVTEDNIQVMYKNWKGL